MSKYFVGTEAECEQVVALIDKQCGYPKRGTHVGGGIHVDMPETFTPGAPGWTATYDVPKADASAKARGFALNVDGFDSVEAFGDKLDAAMTAKLEAATALPADWAAQLDVPADKQTEAASLPS